jgi:hypothetical protein
MRIRDGNNSDPGWKKVGSGIRDKHPGSATLQKLRVLYAVFFLFSPNFKSCISYSVRLTLTTVFNAYRYLLL